MFIVLDEEDNFIDDLETIIAWILNFERKDIPDHVWEIIIRLNGKLNDLFF